MRALNAETEQTPKRDKIVPPSMPAVSRPSESGAQLQKVGSGVGIVKFASIESQKQSMV
jgi:hypothetical protein